MMNERIRQLNSQAYAACKKHEDGTMVLTDEWTEKFAELIIRECIDVVGGFRNSFDDPASDEIRQHFGVV